MNPKTKKQIHICTVHPSLSREEEQGFERQTAKAEGRSSSPRDALP